MKSSVGLDGKKCELKGARMSFWSVRETPSIPSSVGWVFDGAEIVNFFSSPKISPFILFVLQDFQLSFLADLSDRW
jgi:hypothetical protein